MPFKSLSQRRKFYRLKAENKMDQATIDEWERDTPANIPERLEKNAFWVGFFKQADAPAGDGGKGFTGTGKGSYHSQKQQNELMTTVNTGVMDGKELLDRERNPKSFSPFETGEVAESEDGSHVIY